MPINTALIAAITVTANWPSINARKKLITLTNVRKTKNLGKIVRKKTLASCSPSVRKTVGATIAEWKTMVPATSPHNRVIRLLIPSNLGDNMPERDAKNRRNTP
jgi:hypothetical protein